MSQTFGKINQAKFINSTASYSTGVVSITAPSNATVVNFLAPSDFSESDTYSINGVTVPLKNLNNEEIKGNMWVEGSPITFVLRKEEEETVAYFSIGVPGTNDTLPKLLPNFAIDWLDDNTLLLTADMVPAEENPNLAGGRWLYDPLSEDYPSTPNDGVVFEISREEMVYSTQNSEEANG